ncbi:MAG: aminoacyl-tRNA hydrolase [Candidatus Rhabdochlamydia sp.]
MSLLFQNVVTNPLLIVGLGNPGSFYEKTRHNIGFRAVRAFAKRYAMTFHPAQGALSLAAERVIKEHEVHLMLPQSYMNQSGRAVLLKQKSLKLTPEQLLVIVDDIALDVGDVKFKPQGSCGGHNGLKSIEYHLGTHHFPRLRIGVGHPQGKDLADFVLSHFDEKDEENMPQVFNHVADLIEQWIFQGIQHAMGKANTKKS